MRLKIKSLMLFMVCVCSVCGVLCANVSATRGVKKDTSWDLIDFSNVNQVDEDGRTALHRAAMNGNLTMVQRLIIDFHADVAKKDKFGMMPLHCAARLGRSITVKWLLTSGVALEYVDAQDKDGKTALHYAMSLVNEDTSKYLITIGHANAHIQDKVGKEPSAYAKGRNLHIVQSYINSGWKPVFTDVPGHISPLVRVSLVAKDPPHEQFSGSTVEVTGFDESGDILSSIYKKQKRFAPAAPSEEVPGTSVSTPEVDSEDQDFVVTHASRKRRRIDTTLDATASAGVTLEASSNVIDADGGAFCDEAEEQHVSPPVIDMDTLCGDAAIRMVSGVSSIVTDADGGADGLFCFGDTLAQLQDYTDLSNLATPLPYDYDINWYSSYYPDLVLQEHRDFFQ